MQNNIARRILLVILFLSASVASLGQSGEKTFTIPPRDKKAKYRRAVSKERIKLVGEVKIIPLHGAAYVLVTPNLGEVYIGHRGSIPDEVDSRLEWLANNGYTVDATGQMITLCTTRQLKRAVVVGCRVFDEAKAIVIREW